MKNNKKATSTIMFAEILMAILIILLITFFIISNYLGQTNTDTCYNATELNLTLNAARYEGYVFGQEVQVIQMLQALNKQGSFTITYKEVSVPVGLLQE